MLDSTRHESRERAIELLYEAEQKGISPSKVLSELALPPEPYTVDVLATVEQKSDEIDSTIESLSRDWDIDRMPTIDLCVLRIAVAELIDQKETPTPVVIDEAVELAKTYSTEDSGRFVNGVLASAAKLIRSE